MRSLIYGYGDTGKSFERYLKDKKIDFDIFDSNIAEHNQNYNFEDFDQILCSPGAVSYTHLTLPTSDLV